MVYASLLIAIIWNLIYALRPPFVYVDEQTRLISYCAISWFLIYKVGKRRNWARISLLVFFAYNVRLSISPTIVSLTHEPIASAFNLVPHVMQAVALVFLFQDSSSPWFEAGRTKDRLQWKEPRLRTEIHRLDNQLETTRRALNWGWIPFILVASIILLLGFSVIANLGWLDDSESEALVEQTPLGLSNLVIALVLFYALVYKRRTRIIRELTENRARLPD